MQHVEAEPVDGGCWRLVLRCPECEWSAEALHRHEDVLRYDSELAAGEVLLARALYVLQSENMAEWVDRFSSALASDAVVPTDF